MRHNREEVINRTILEFELLDRLVANLTNEEWNRLVPRSESKDPWTVKDALAHITHWKADVARSARRQRAQYNPGKPSRLPTLARPHAR